MGVVDRKGRNAIFRAAARLPPAALFKLKRAALRCVAVRRAALCRFGKAAIHDEFNSFSVRYVMLARYVCG